jgi:hypothetical protein
VRGLDDMVIDGDDTRDLSHTVRLLLDTRG